MRLDSGRCPDPFTRGTHAWTDLRDDEQRIIGRGCIACGEQEQFTDIEHLLASPVNAERLRRSLQATARGDYTEHDLIDPEDGA
ncbi:MAG: hypothetical protein EOO27_14050 [Comamonadaceae bacterium]|nr:MAG: hypothetical protein EOO27_14050 [Comamonadaceae bacterium]